jgi:cellulose synthase/poly-beta-1,6-N-acetylglucosamine synthase-like glycosyltransferase
MAASVPAVPRRRRIVVALPGREFSGTFLMAWTRALQALWRLDWDVVVLNRFSSFVTFSRMQTLGLDVLRGADQKPFNGELEYDVWVTIDSDVVFTPEQLIELVESTDVHSVVCGAYRMADLKHYAVVQTWDTAFFASTGSFQFLTPEAVEAWRATTQQKFMPVSYAGMGFMAVRREALERLSYPYFFAPLQEIAGADGRLLRDVCSEDVAFCKNLEAAGDTIYLHTGLRVGHEKSLVI